jgi:hypothetical protein
VFGYLDKINVITFAFIYRHSYYIKYIMGGKHLIEHLGGDKMALGFGLSLG